MKTGSLSCFVQQYTMFTPIAVLVCDYLLLNKCINFGVKAHVSSASCNDLCGVWLFPFSMHTTIMGKG